MLLCARLCMRENKFPVNMKINSAGIWFWCLLHSEQDADLEKRSDEHISVSAISKDISSGTHQSGVSQSTSSVSLQEAQRCMSLYFALCTKVKLCCGNPFVILLLGWSILSPSSSQTHLNFSFVDRNIHYFAKYLLFIKTLLGKSSRWSIGVLFGVC